MPDYDFHQLSPYDLEVLVRDLLQAEWNVLIESFKSGRDKGIDLRYASGANHSVVQVKHYLRTGIAGLLRDLGKEQPKVEALKPNRYIVATSVPLSPADKDSIVTIFGAEVLKPGDVLGQAEINNLLGRHPEIEQQHFKLWLASRAVLDRVLRNAEITQSKFKVQQVYEKAKRYVAGRAYREAFKMLNEHRVAVVSGPPGVGKTTLADLLLYQYLENGYQAILIQRDIAEGANLFEAGKPQIFYFDDFMGATFLGDRPAGMTAVQDQALLNFIAMIRASPNARLILTTREHIYAQALSRSERLRQSDLDDLRIILHMPSYTFSEKARILYNHLYFSDLPPEYVDELLRDEFYFQIVKHERFNPRLIEWLSSYRRLRNVPVKSYPEFVLSLLRDPFEIWEHAYREELTDAGRSLLLTIHSLDGKASSNRLRNAFNAVHRQRASRYGFSTRPEDFQLALQETSNVFLKPTGYNGFEVLDPSVLDLMNVVVRRIPENVIDVLLGAKEFEQIKKMWLLANANQGGLVFQAIKDAAAQLSPIILKLAIEGRRVPFEGGVAYVGPTYEERLSLIVSMAQSLSRSAITKIVGAVFERLKGELETESIAIVDAVDLLRSLESATNVPDAQKMIAIVRKKLLAEAADGCRVDELREVISVINTTDPSSEEVAAARVAFSMYSALHFNDDLRECRSGEQFDSLIEDLQLFREELGADVDGMIERVEEAKSEYEEHQEAYADHMQDEWKERSRDERAGDRAVSDMFGSLKNDRN